jgi:hypothetical protein
MVHFGYVLMPRVLLSKGGLIFKFTAAALLEFCKYEFVLLRAFSCALEFFLKKLIAQSSRMNGTAFHTIMTVKNIRPPLLGNGPQNKQ